MSSNDTTSSDSGHPPVDLDDLIAEIESTSAVADRVDLEFSTYKEISWLARAFNITRTNATRFLEALHVPLLYVARGIYFNAIAFECVLYLLTKTGGAGFAVKGSEYIIRGKHRDSIGKKPLYEATPELLKEAASQEILLEMLVSRTKDKTLVKSLLALKATEAEKARN